MAKTSGGGGGLFGRADSTLVAAAFKEGQSKVGADLGDVYEKREESLKTLGTGIQTAFDNIFAEQEAEQEKTNESIQKFNPDQQFEAMMNSHIDAVEWQKGELARIDKTHKKGSTEYRKAMAKFNSNKEEYFKKLLKWQDIFDDIKDKGSNNAIFGYEAGSPMQKLLGSIFQDANENTDLTKPKYDSKLNDLVYTLPGSDQEMIPNPEYVDATQTPSLPKEIENKDYKAGGVQMTLSELYENLETRDNTAPLAVSTAITNIIKQGKTSNVPKETRISDFHSDLINNIMVNHQDIVNVGKDAGLPGMDGNSVEQYLTQPDKLDKGVKNPVLAEIYGILKTMDVDYNADNIIDAADKTFVSADNAVELAKNIMKEDSVYKKVIAKVISEQAGNNAFDRGAADKEKGKSNRNKNIEEGEGGYFPKGTSWVHLGPDRDAYSVGDAEGLIDDIKNGDTFEFLGNFYDYVNGGWYENYKEGDTVDSESHIGDPESLRLNVIKSKDAAFRNLKTEKIVKKDIKTGEVIEKTEPKKTELFNLMNVRNDDTVSENLNTKFNLSQRGNVMFAPYEGRSGLGSYGTGLFDADDTSTNDLMLYNPQTQEPYKVNGEIIRIPSGLERSEEEMMKSIDDILKHLASLGVKTGFGGKTAKEYIEEGS